MAGKRPIDTKRDAAITLQIGGDDKSPIKEFLSTANGLYVIKETGVFKLQLADDIDPGRTNPTIPNLSQQVLAAGYDDEIVARVLLTAKYLFDERNATVKPFVASLFGNCLVLTRQLLELDLMARELADDIRRKESLFAGKPAAPNAFTLPSVPELSSKLHDILAKADKVKDTMLVICRLQFLPNAALKGKLQELDTAVATAMQAEPELVTGWKEHAKFFSLIRNMRNASEHSADNFRIILADFSMQPDGKVNPPLAEIQHPDTPIGTLPVVELIETVRNEMLERAEAILVFIRLAGLLKDNPFDEWVAEFPQEARRHRFVRYYRAINVNGALQILG